MISDKIDDDSGPPILTFTSHLVLFLAVLLVGSTIFKKSKAALFQIRSG